MFKNQRGPCVELFTTGGKPGDQPQEHWKLSGTTIQKHFSNDVKSSVFSLEGTTTSTKMQIPKNAKDNLNLMHGFLVLQVSVPPSRDFALELIVSDMECNRLRLALSTIWREVKVTPLDSKIPLDLIRRSTWLNLCIDVGSLVKESWLRSSFKSLEGITISGNCHLRRVFTMRSQAMDTTNDDELYGVQCNENVALESVPMHCQLARGVPHLTQVINFSKVCSFLAKMKGATPDSVRPIGAERSSVSQPIGGQTSFSIVFGSKVASIKGRTPARSAESRPARDASGARRQPQDRSVSDLTTSRSTQVDTERPSQLDFVNDTKISDSAFSIENQERTEREVLIQLNQLSSNDDREDFLFTNPHPPPKGANSTTQNRPRRIRKCIANAKLVEKPVDVTATDEEVDRILSEMQEKARRRILNPASESESGLSDASSRCASEGPEESDSSFDVIHTLNGTLKNKEREEDIIEARKVYIFASRPSEPRRPHNKKMPRQPPTSNLLPGSAVKSNALLPSYESDVYTNGHQNAVLSSDSGDDRDFDVSEMSQVDSPAHRVTGNVRKVLPPPSSIAFPRINGGTSPRTSISWVRSVSRSSLREIPAEDMRRSGGEKSYHPNKYRDELTESYERYMLQKIQNDSLDANSGDENEDRRSSPYRPRSAYGNDETDSSDDTSTLKTPRSSRNPDHNYRDEWRKLQQDPTQSNSREWGTMSIYEASLAMSSTDKSILEHSHYSKQKEVGHSSRRNKDDDSPNEDLDLCYDSVLRKFYDPQTQKYYELITPA